MPAVTSRSTTTSSGTPVRAGTRATSTASYTGRCTAGGGGSWTSNDSLDAFACPPSLIPPDIVTSASTSNRTPSIVAVPPTSTPPEPVIVSGVTYSTSAAPPTDTPPEPVHSISAASLTVMTTVSVSV